MKSLFLLSVKIPVILAGLSAGLSLSHVLEIPGKHRLTALEFVHVHHTFYGGYAIFGAAAWIYCSAAGLIAGLKFYKINKRISGYSFSAAAAFIICIAIFGFFLNHYNQLIRAWNDVLPENWKSIRNHWEVSHIVVFVFTTVSFILFLNAYGLINKSIYEKSSC